MGRKPGSRLAKRKAKRELAKATRTTKYADQKGGGGRPGGGISKSKRTGRRKGDRPLDSVVQPAMPSEEVAGPNCDDEKALRAFTKKLRMIEELKQRQRKGEELNREQLAKISREEYVLKQIIRLTSQPEGSHAQGSDDEDEPVVVRPHHLSAPRQPRR
mmetsp:Transcript_12314/g.32219  ORF Transcript_12314/g.32219 Transcript_12314/m.32219 type:complete len:159 (+) Transcript_12314:131-607(+)